MIPSVNGIITHRESEAPEKSTVYTQHSEVQK